MALKEFCCKNCGSNLKNFGGTYWECPDCGHIYKDTEDRSLLDIIAGTISRKFTLNEIEKIEKLRTNLVISGQAEYPSFKRIENICTELSALVPCDGQAELYSAMCGNNPRNIDRCIGGYSVYAGRINLDDDIRFAVRTLKSTKNFSAVQNLIERYFAIAPQKAEEIKGKFEEKKSEIKNDVRNVNVDRDIFVSYDSGDIRTVYDLVNFLEKSENGFTCFVADRNLPEEDDPYWNNIFGAMKNCKIFLFVSGKSSRNNDNVLKEIRHWMNDGEMKNCSYRAEYVIEKHEKTNLSLREKSINKYFSDVYNWFEAGEEDRLAEKLYDYKLKAEEQSIAYYSNSDKQKKTEAEKPASPAIEKQELSCQELNEMADNLYKQGDFKEAFALWEKSAWQGDAYAQYNLGVCYNKGEGVEQDYNEAVKWFTKSAEQGDASAQCDLGKCYYNGLGVKRNTKKAVKWIEKSAEQGYAMAQNNLGWCYFYGEGVKKDAEEAVKWIKKSAEQGNADAQDNLGIFYTERDGIKKNYQEAVKWFRKSVAQGDSNAQYHLGYCYEYSIGVEEDINEAVKLYMKSAEHGNEWGQYHLGKCYEKGNGVEKDINEAIKWFKKSAEQGNMSAKNALNELRKEEL